MKLAKEKKVLKDEFVELGDTINLDLEYEGEELENMTITLTQHSANLDLGEISLNSKLGDYIHKKNIGHIGFYLTEHEKVMVRINKKIVKQKKKI